MSLGRYKADLHVHTCLSPCAELEMSPMRIAERARAVGLDVIAVCDHNSAENAGAVMTAGEKRNLTVLPGMEITSSEEVHIIGLFPTLSAALKAQEVVYSRLPGKNEEDVFGVQVVANEDDEVVELNGRLLIGATEMDLEDVVNLIHEHGGLAIAAHIDREGFSILGQLGFVPEGLSLDGLELSPRARPENLEPAYRSRWTLLASSDAHRLDEIGSAITTLISAGTSLEELGFALSGERGRSVEI
jgi:predicted metal-dependent phosphoesterase TrpH